MDDINRREQSTEFSVRVSSTSVSHVQDNVDEALELTRQSAMDLADEVASAAAAVEE